MPVRPRLLIVDDELSILEVVAQWLEQLGYAVIAYQDPRAALNWLMTNEPPAAVLIDMWMPGMDGWSVWSQMRFIPRVQHVPVVMLSGDVRITQRAQAAGLAGVLCKPFTSEQLSQVVAAVAPRPSTRDVY